MKKFALILLAGLLLFLVACGTETEPDSAESTEPTPSSEPESKYYFRDGVLVSGNLKIVITDWHVIPMGEAGNEYGDKSVIAFWYDITNISGIEGISPMIGWMVMFKAIQNNDHNMASELEIADHPDDELADNQMVEIKKGETTQGAWAYELDDETTPVKLIATQGIRGEELGEQEFDIAQ